MNRLEPKLRQGSRTGRARPTVARLAHHCQNINLPRCAYGSFSVGPRSIREKSGEERVNPGLGEQADQLGNRGTSAWMRELTLSRFDITSLNSGNTPRANPKLNRATLMAS